MIPVKKSTKMESKYVNGKQIQFLKIGDTKVADVFMAPGFTFEYDDKVAIWNWVRTLRNQTDLEVLAVDRADMFWISVVDGNVQIHDGNHRFVALAITYPSLTINDIAKYIKFIHYRALDDDDIEYLHSVDHGTMNRKIRFWFHSSAVLPESKFFKTTTVEDPGHCSTCMTVAEMVSETPVSFNNNEIFHCQPKRVGSCAREILLEFLGYCNSTDQIDNLRDSLINAGDTVIPLRKVVEISTNDLINNSPFRELVHTNPNFDIAGSFTRWAYGARRGMFSLTTGKYSYKFYNRLTGEWLPPGLENHHFAVIEQCGELVIEQI
jgi:hypothetical protein